MVQVFKVFVVIILCRAVYIPILHLHHLADSLTLLANPPFVPKPTKSKNDVTVTKIIPIIANELQSK